MLVPHPMTECSFHNNESSRLLTWAWVICSRRTPRPPGECPPPCGRRTNAPSPAARRAASRRRATTGPSAVWRRPAPRPRCMCRPLGIKYSQAAEAARRSVLGRATALQCPAVSRLGRAATTREEGLLKAPKGGLLEALQQV
eukprot:362837-Chlamydomonas_euryale.AAC.11